MATLGNQKDASSPERIIFGDKVMFPAHSVVIGGKIVHIPTQVMYTAPESECFGVQISKMISKFHSRKTQKKTDYPAK